MVALLCRLATASPYPSPSPGIQTKMDRFPAEVLRNIFLEAISELYWYLDSQRYTNPRYLDVPEYINTPLRISHVCRSWRYTAISSRILWSYLLIEDDTIFSRSNIKALFDLWLERSNGAPLSYKFDLLRHGYSLRSMTDTILYLSNALLSQQHRWKDVEFLWTCGPFTFHQKTFPVQAFSMTNMPMLNSLSVQLFLPHHATIDLGRSSKLKKVAFVGNFSLSARKNALPHLSSKCLLEFDVSRDDAARESVRSCLELLEASPFLEEICIILKAFDVSGRRPLIPSETHSLTLPRLRLLRLTSINDESGTLLDRIHLPALEALAIDSQESSQDVLNLLSRSMPSLTFLSMEVSPGIDMPERDVIEILGLLPSLKDLRLNQVFLSPHFFRELAIDDSVGGSVLCPALETLSLNNIRYTEDEMAYPQALTAMLESRARNMASFGKIRFRYIEKGMDVSLLKEFPTTEWKKMLEERTIIISPSDFIPSIPFNGPLWSW